MDAGTSCFSSMYLTQDESFALEFFVTEPEQSTYAGNPAQAVETAINVHQHVNDPSFKQTQFTNAVTGVM